SGPRARSATPRRRPSHESSERYASFVRFTFGALLEYDPCGIAPHLRSRYRNTQCRARSDAVLPPNELSVRWFGEVLGARVSCWVRSWEYPITCPAFVMRSSDSIERKLKK